MYSYICYLIIITCYDSKNVSIITQESSVLTFKVYFICAMELICLRMIA